MTSNKKNISSQVIALRLLARIADHAVAAQNPEKNHGLTPLHSCAFNNLLQETKELLESNMNPNVTDEFGWTPLHDAAIQGHTQIVKLLLAAGAQVNVQDKEDLYTPLHDAARMNHIEVVKLLLAAGADASITDRWNNTPLDIANQYKYQEIVDILS